MTIESERYLYGDRALWLHVSDLTAAHSDAIVLAAEPDLSPRGSVTAGIVAAGGAAVNQQTQQLRREYGTIDAGMALYTTAGELPFESLIHAVVAADNDDDASRVLEQAVSRSLQLCELNEWQRMALPALGSDEPGLDVTAIARAIYRAVTRFWDARQEGLPHTVHLCLIPEQFPVFREVFEQAGMDPPASPEAGDSSLEPAAAVGQIELSDEDIDDLNDVDIDEWFK